jgi:hypothetical protein
MQTPLIPEPFTQVEPGLQSLLSKQLFAPFAVSLVVGPLSSSSVDFAGMHEASTHVVPAVQSESTLHRSASAGVERRQKMVTTHATLALEALNKDFFS